jgi:DNA repair ATPase RecN
MTENAGVGTDNTNVAVGGVGAGNLTDLQSRIAGLEALNAQLTKNLEEQRNIQAGLDRTVAQKERALAALSEEVNQYKTITSGDNQALSEAQKAIEAMSTKVAELGSAQAELEQIKTTNERLRLLMEKHPGLSYLAANDALPQATTNEEFLQKLDNIAGTVSSAATVQAQSLISGGRPAAQPPAGQGDENPADLWKRGTNLMANGQIDEGRALIDKYWAMQNK